ncbi:phosphoribosylglycinamide formyltransferase [Candidatus Parcubacteria bacterium]|nr:phosphoribosylglycinamide formyltransferase [Patescibacteria group bacterium]MBU4308950.1 phosphoribosylglycinamide formyltransferase [Patescibacteria group bacterium]MBU4431879.1 phosphoribosylglycinamide formyltransferase [Patescibacteria group bacterium]MBU4577310.1 phosphoribosylglycinamide formyltransferase [Patescibacteria group bacterium]MCG2697000.1 phosphoribosylglycinamide formyltransferase [Candidatus Parcubacteria bacterium]
MVKKRLRIGVLISGGGSNLQAIIDACESGQIDGEVVFVGSDKPDVYGLERATKHGIPSFVVDYREFKNERPSTLFGYSVLNDTISKSCGIIPSSRISNSERQSWMLNRIMAEEVLLDNIKKYEFDLLVLAGYMRNMSSFIIDEINKDSEKPRIMNIHPALLPAFPGTDGYGDTFRYGCKVGGCTVHFVDYGEDTGPIIGQQTVSIHPGDTLEMFKERGLKAEWALYRKCVQLYAENRLKVVDIGTRKVVQILPWKKNID